MKRISNEGITLIKEFEGLYLTAYKCPAGVWTIGWGCTDGVRPGQRITEAQAESMLRAELSKFEAGVDRLVKVPLSQSEFDALVSFAYNVGLGALGGSTLLAKLNRGDRPGAAAEFPRWNKVNGAPLAGLTRRRAAEQRLFLNTSPAATPMRAFNDPETPRYKATQETEATLEGGVILRIPKGAEVAGVIAGGILKVTAVSPGSAWELVRDPIALTLTQKTVLKATPSPAITLNPSDKSEVSGVIAVYAVEPAADKHLRVELVEPVKGRSSWYVYVGHVDAATLPDYAAPRDDAPAQPSGPEIEVPGVGRVALNAAIIPGGNFTWSEATKGGSRVPESAEIARAIVRMAGKMQTVRSWLGDRPVTITSWYRPPAVNKAVGGARNSTHLQGHGVDFVVAGLSPGQVQRILDPKWGGGLGYGRSFTHLDDRGYRARWNYGS